VYAQGRAQPGCSGAAIAGDDGHVVVYDHARCALVGTPVPVSGGTVTALGSDPESGLVVPGTSGGGLRVMRWNDADGAPQLRLLRQSSPYASGIWIQAVRLFDRGRRLISVSRTGEVAEWDSATLERRRLFPTTLRRVYQASFVPGEPWLVLSGTLSEESDDGKVELLDLRTGFALRYKANTNLPVSTLLPEASFGLILQSGSVKGIRYLDE
jgi:WD40 repeat protein